MDVGTTLFGIKSGADEQNPYLILALAQGTFWHTLWQVKAVATGSIFLGMLVFYVGARLCTKNKFLAALMAATPAVVEAGRTMLIAVSNMVTAFFARGWL